MCQKPPVLVKNISLDKDPFVFLTLLGFLATNVPLVIGLVNNCATVYPVPVCSFHWL